MKEPGVKSVPLWTKNFCKITLLNFLIFFGFQMLLPTLPFYIKQLGGGDASVGLVTGIFTISAIVARPFAGLMLDRIGRREVFLVGLVIFVLSVLAYNWFPIIELIIVFRLIHGLGWGAATTASNTIAADNIPKKRFGEGIGYFSLSGSLAMAIAPAIGLSLINRYHFSSLFFTSAGLLILVFILALTIRYRHIAREEPGPVKAAFYEKSSLRPSIVIFFVATSYGTIISFLALYAAQRGIENIALFFTIYAFSLLISRPVFGKINDQLGADYAAIPGLIGVFTAMVILSRASTLPVFLMVAFIYGVGFGAVLATMQTMAVVNVHPGRRGAANATFFTGFDSGIGLGSIILGAIASVAGYSQMYLWGALSVVIAFILYFVVLRSKGGSGKVTASNNKQ
ncbi:MAG: MFS transporter [Halanaerobiales bacterium]|nr:MFS transporter [Halanaerobiales bacterium]